MLPGSRSANTTRSHRPRTRRFPTVADRLQRGRLLTLTVDGQPDRCGPPPPPSRRPCAELGQDPSAFKLSADRSRPIPLDGLTVSADTLHTVTVTNDGAATQVTSAAKTVGDLFTEIGYHSGPTSKVTPDSPPR